MAEFCKQCTDELYKPGLLKKENYDFYGLTPANTYLQVLCEGCGETLVDSEGFCAWPHCSKHGDEIKAKMDKEEREENDQT